MHHDDGRPTPPPRPPQPPHDEPSPARRLAIALGTLAPETEPTAETDLP